ncbi:MAG: FAD binding domain-containing protein [Candidatus Omnitrophota bacterium]
MIFKNFNYYRPETIEEAQRLLSSKENCRIISGGTFILPFLKNQEIFPKNIIGLKNITSLKNIEKTDDFISIGSTATLDDIKRSNLIKNYIPVLNKFIPEIATPQIRNMASIGGNITCGLPWADLVFLLLALDAELRFTEKNISIKDYLLQRKDFTQFLLKYINIPRINITKYFFIRIPRSNSTDIPLASVCIIKADKDYRVSCNLGNALPQRFPKTEKALQDGESNIEVVFNDELNLLQKDELRRRIISVNFRRLLNEYKNKS